MAKLTHDEIEKYYKKNSPLWEAFLRKIDPLIRDLLKAKGIRPQGIFNRVKELSSFERKCDKWNDPFTEITDKCGIRIITYTLGDVKKVSDIIEEEFDVKECINKLEELRPGEFGYNCTHYVVKLKAPRSKLTEYRKYADLYLEIQIPTILQHAWAEIEHDLNYKSASEPPKEIQRSLSRVAAVLELTDKEFGLIVNNIEKYKQQVKLDIQDKKEVEINSLSIMEYMNGKFDMTEISKSFRGHDTIILDELENFGIKTISQLDAIITEKFTDTLKETAMYYNRSYLGILREAMMVSDLEKYFAKSWRGGWNGLIPPKDKFLTKMGVNITRINEIITENEALKQNR